MKKRNSAIYISLALVLAFGAMFLPSNGCAAEDGPVAAVTVTPIATRTISRLIVAYGTIIPAPGAAEEISVPYESQVKKVLVRPGQAVSKGDPLVEVAPSPDTRLKFQLAKVAYETAKLRLEDVENKMGLKLATNDELFQAQEACSAARHTLQSFEETGATDLAALRAAGARVVDEIPEQEGAVVAAGGPLVKIIAAGALECLLGGEAEEADLFKPGQTVSLSPVNRPGAPPITGRIRTVSRSINPTTRLVDVFVVPDNPDGLLLNEYIKGEITIASAKGLVAPRSAVLKTGDQFYVFTVKNNRATKHIVQPGIQNETEVQFLGQDVNAGDAAVNLGNYELEDGMAVKVEESK